jgi:hypothetical protein
MLFGRVHAGESGVDVALSLVDTETSQVLVTVDVYGEGRSPEALQWLSRGLVLKMRQRFPVLRGTVVFVTARGFHVDAGAESGAVVGMKLLLFRELEPSPGLVLKEPLGLEARVQQVEAATCRAEVVGKKAEPGVKVADSVIAK